MDDADRKVTDFKQRVEKEWAGDDAAAAWQKHYPQMRAQLAQVTEALVEAAAPRPGMSILDLASGTGEPALTLAQRVGPTGRVTATDLSGSMLAALTTNAIAEGVTNLETKVCDAEELPFSDASFDVVTSRFGVMFFADVQRSLAEVKRVLKRGGSLALMVWGQPLPSSYFGAATMPYVRRLATKPDPDGPGPMRFAEPGKLVRLVEGAGYHEVRETILTLPAPYRGTPEEMLTAIMEIAAPLRNLAATLSDEDQRAAQRDAYDNLRPLYDGTFTNVTAPVLIVRGVSR